jgi:SAM-dependent methyltransferase
MTATQSPAERGPAAQRWAEALEAWAIPEEILAAAPASPWSFPPSIFARKAARALADPAPSPSRGRALEALTGGGEVLDVGVGGGAASLPLAPPATRLVGVDQSGDLLESFASAVEGRGVTHQEVQGSWPDVADLVGPADVVVCHHVAYNVADLVPFVAALTAHARHRVVLELTALHPLTSSNPLWLEIHGVVRPTSPTAADAVAVLEEMGLAPSVEPFERSLDHSHDELAEIVPFVRRQLCVGADRDVEIESLLRRHGRAGLGQAVTLWWDTV